MRKKTFTFLSKFFIVLAGIYFLFESADFIFTFLGELSQGGLKLDLGVFFRKETVEFLLLSAVCYIAEKQPG